MKNAPTLEISKGYIELYKGCERFLCQTLGIQEAELRAHVEQLIVSDTLKKYFVTLQESATAVEGVFICDATMFIHKIDHYDDEIQEHKRDKTGSYYTPEPIVSRMVAAVLAETAVAKKIKKRERIHLLEPTCGTMTFVRTLMKQIHAQTEESRYLKFFMDGVITVDLQPEPLMLGILSILYEGFRLTGHWSMKWQVRCMDALKIKDLEDVMDVVVGNPPYLGKKGNGPFFRQLKEDPDTAKYYEGRMDLYYFFIHVALDVLKPSGCLSFITTNYFTTADSAKKLRERLQREGVFKQLTDYSGDGLFKSARGQHNVSFIYEKKTPALTDKCEVIKIGQQKDDSLIELSTDMIENNCLYDHKGLISLSGDKEVYRLLEKIKAQSTGELSDVFDVKQGIVSGADFVTKSMLERKLSPEDLSKGIEKGNPIYVFPKSEVHPFEGPWKDFYKNSDIDKYSVSEDPKYQIYYVCENNAPTQEGLSHLERFKSVLVKRREVTLGYREWYELQWPRTSELFEQPKLVMPQRSRSNIFAYVPGGFYGSADIYYIIHETQDVSALLYLNGVINSKLYYFWLYHRGKKKGELLELYSTPIKSLPVIHFNGVQWQSKIIELVERLRKNKDKYLMDQIDFIVYEGFSLTDDEIETVEAFYKKMTKGA